MRLHAPPLRVWAWACAVVALVVLAGLLWRGSDAAATRSTTTSPAPPLPGVPAATVSASWSATGSFLPDEIVQSGRVIVGSGSGIRALDPMTGEEAWRYTRANATLCGLSATNGVVVAVFRTEDRCDEAVALRSGTGVRAWTRNVDFSGDATIDGTDRIVLASTPTGVATLDPTGNSLRWRYRPPAGCLIIGSEVGSAGVALLQQCGSGSALNLRLLDGFDGAVHWTRDLPTGSADDVTLLGAEQLIGIAIGGEVQLLSREDGAVLQRLPTAGSSAQMTSSGGLVLVRTGDTLSAVDAASGAVTWAAPAIGLPGRPTAQKNIGGVELLLVPVTDGFSHRVPATGAETSRTAAPGFSAGGTATAAGPVIVLRSGDRVTGFG